MFVIFPKQNMSEDKSSYFFLHFFLSAYFIFKISIVSKIIGNKEKQVNIFTQFGIERFKIKITFDSFLEH